MNNCLRKITSCVLAIIPEKLLYCSLSLLLLLLKAGSDPCLAGSWLIPAGSYKTSYTLSTIDDRSDKLKRLHQELYLELQQQILELSEQRQKLQNQIDSNKGIATNYQKRIMGMIDQEISTLKQAASEEKAYQDKERVSMMIEYGLTSDISIGAKADYKNEQLSHLDCKNIITQEADIFLKYKVFDNGKSIMTIQPKIYLNRYNRKREHWFGEMGFMVGYSFNPNSFCDAGVFVSNCLINHCTSRYIVGISFSEGLKFDSGFALYNFTKYYIRKTDNRIYNRSVYEQILVAKEIGFDDSHHNYLTLAAGYFFDQSLIDKSFKLSGPIFSLWMQL